jgi:hypothetical protein
MSLVGELDRLSLTLNSLNEDQAKSIIEYVNQVIGHQLHPHIIDILWKEEGREGLNRVVTLMPKPGMCLERSGRGQGGAYFIPQEVSANTRGLGLWAWVHKTDEPVWIENISMLPGLVNANGYLVARDVTKSNRSIINQATDKIIDPRYFSAFHTTDSIMIVPLFSRNLMCGIYSMELPTSGLLTRQTLDLLTQLSRPLARILYKVEVADLSLHHTTRAIDLFKQSMRGTQPSWPLNEFRSAFIARPFKPEMEKLENCITKCLLENGIKAEHYEPSGGRPQILEDIVKSIRSSHFVIADLTGNNPNVLLELGIAIASEKEVLIFKSKDDQADLPFDLNPYPYYRYAIGPRGRISISKPAGGSTPCRDIVKKLVSKLERDPGFLIAKLWNPTNKRSTRSGSARRQTVRLGQATKRPK